MRNRDLKDFKECLHSSLKVVQKGEYFCVKEQENTSKIKEIKFKFTQKDDVLIIQQDIQNCNPIENLFGNDKDRIESCDFIVLLTKSSSGNKFCKSRLSLRPKGRKGFPLTSDPVQRCAPLKKSLAVLMSLAMLLTGAAAAEAKITLKVANSGPDTPENRTVCAADVYTDMVRKATNGEVELVFYHASKLGGEAEALEGIQMGTIDMGTLTSGPAANFVPQTMVFDIPYLIKSSPAGWEFLKFMTNTENSITWANGTGYLPVRQSCTEQDAYKQMVEEDPNLQVITDNVQYCAEATFIPEYAETKDIIANEIQKCILEDNYTPEQAVQSMADRVAELFQ